MGRKLIKFVAELCVSILRHTVAIGLCWNASMAFLGLLDIPINTATVFLHFVVAFCLPFFIAGFLTGISDSNHPMTIALLGGMATISLGYVAIAIFMDYDFSNIAPAVRHLFLAIFSVAGSCLGIYLQKPKFQ